MFSQHHTNRAESSLQHICWPGSAAFTAEDELEDGAYVVLDEEDEDGPQAATEGPARASNGTGAQPMSGGDDRYVATAYSADEEGTRYAAASQILFICTCM